MKSYHLRIHSIGNLHLEDSKLLKTLQNWELEIIKLVNQLDIISPVQH